MKFTEHVLMAALLAPTAAIAAAALISIAAIETNAPAEPAFRDVAIALFYADLERQP